MFKPINADDGQTINHNHMKEILFYSFATIAAVSFIGIFLCDHAGPIFTFLISALMAVLVACAAKEDAEAEKRRNTYR